MEHVNEDNVVRIYWISIFAQTYLERQYNAIKLKKMRLDIKETSLHLRVRCIVGTHLYKSSMRSPALYNLKVNQVYRP